MKKFLTLIIAALTIGAFADTYTITEAERLYNEFRKKQTEKSPETEAARQEYYKYILESEVDATSSRASYHQIVRLVTVEFMNEKNSKPTQEQIDARIEKYWKVEDDPNDDKTLLRAELYRRYRLPEAILELNDPKFNWLLWDAYFASKRYQEALDFAIRTERWYDAFKAAVPLKDNAKIFEYGRKTFITGYVTSPRQATSILTAMLKPDYTGIVSHEEIAAFLKEISIRYPAPDADMEAWRGFLGFVGYRYKTITGEDLFKK